MKWIKFLRKYGPIPRNDNMYDETIFRAAKRQKIKPLEFKNPFEIEVQRCFAREYAVDPVSVILTGTAGDGKTHLCRKVWEFLGGDESAWLSDNPYLKTAFMYPEDRKEWPKTSLKETPHLFRKVTIHIVRDLSAWAPQQGHKLEPEKAELIRKFCNSLFNENADEIFLIAGNDGQLIETFRRLEDTPEVIKTRQVFEELLVEGKQQMDRVYLRFFNLSRGKSVDLFKLAIKEFIKHPGWQECKDNVTGENSAFGPKCPIRHNYELLQTKLVQNRIATLFELCDHMGLHIPLRQILLLLTNAVLGHPDVKDRLMVPGDVPGLIEEDTTSKASIYNNIFGGNLTEARRQSITVFDYFDRFQIGHETSNRIDNILLYGDTDPILRGYYKDLIESDSFYGADKRFYTAKHAYIEGMDEDENSSKEFLELLISQRRGLFFKIPLGKEEELRLWELTVFKFAGEYISKVWKVVQNSKPVDRPIINRLARGLNRIFTGMLINEDHNLILATSGNYSQAKISMILVDRVSVRLNKGECVTVKIDPETSCILLVVQLSPEISEALELNLIRYEFLSRIAEDGALPASFSRECYEDILAFKSQIIAALNRRESVAGNNFESRNELRILTLSDQGMVDDKYVEVKL